MTDRWWLDVRDKPGVLWALCRQFSGRGDVSFEGNLKRFELLNIPGANDTETAVLRRATLVPQQDFVVVQLTDQTIDLLMQRLSGGRVFGRLGDVVHTQLQSEGQLIFGAYDNFHRDCVVAYATIPSELLQRLQAKGMLRSYVPAAEQPVAADRDR